MLSFYNASHGTITSVQNSLFFLNIAHGNIPNHALSIMLHANKNMREGILNCLCKSKSVQGLSRKQQPF